MRYWENRVNHFQRGKAYMHHQLFTDAEMKKYKLDYAQFNAVELNRGDTCILYDMRFKKQDMEHLGFIEIDADGVILAIHTHINKYVQDLYSGFDGDKHISSWGMHELNNLHPELRSRILGLFTDVGFMSTVPVYLSSDIALHRLLDFCNYDSMLIPIINTHCYSQKIGRVRKRSLSAWLINNDIPIKVIVSVGYEKVMLNKNIIMCIEDNADNLIKSSAKIKCLVSRGHNRFITSEYILSKQGSKSRVICGGQLNNYVDLLIKGVLQ